MQSNTHDDAKVSGVKVYEIGYTLLSTIAKEKVADQTAQLKEILAKAGASIIAHEDPELMPLAYTITKKIHGANQRFDEGYFGWLKFKLPADAIVSVKKSFDGIENMLRYLLMITVEETTYLGKRAPAYTGSRDAGMISPDVGAPELIPEISASAPVTVAPVGIVVSVEDMDKSIDDMVKGA